MDIILSSAQWTTTDVNMINRCRIYLQVETISDLTNARGDSILPSVYFCMEEGRLRTSMLWPHQPRPGPRHRTKWQQFIDMLCTVPTYMLNRPLGMWIKPSKRKWDAYYDPTLNTVLILQNNQWYHYLSRGAQQRLSRKVTR